MRGRLGDERRALLHVARATRTQLLKLTHKTESHVFLPLLLGLPVSCLPPGATQGPSNPL